MKKNAMRGELRVNGGKGHGKTAIATKEYIIELQGRISEAIRYINKEYFKREQLEIAEKYFQEWQMQELLKILKGE